MWLDRQSTTTLACLSPWWRQRLLFGDISRSSQLSSVCQSALHQFVTSEHVQRGLQLSQPARACAVSPSPTTPLSGSLKCYIGDAVNCGIGWSPQGIHLASSSLNPSTAMNHADKTREPSVKYNITTGPISRTKSLRLCTQLSSPRIC